MTVVTTERTEADEAGTVEAAETTQSVEAVDPTQAVEAADEGPVAEEPATDEPFQPRRDTASWRNRPWRDVLRRGLLPGLLAISLAANGWFGWQQWQEHREQQAGQQALQAAITYAGALTSLDANNVDQNFREVLDGATGEFKDMYTRSSVQLRQLLIDNKASSHGVVVQSAIQSQSANQVVVLLFIDQTVTNKSVPDPRIDRSRIKMTMEKVDGRWRASKVQLL